MPNPTAPRRARIAALAAELRPEFQRISATPNPVSYSYRAYGVGIDSTTEIAGLEPCPRDTWEATLHFETGPEPEWVKRGRELPGRVISHLPECDRTADPSFVLIEYKERQCYELSYSDGTRFVVNDAGDRVWGTCQEPLTKEDLATYFLGPVMGFLLRYKQITCLHASGVEVLGHAVAFSGDAGYGKSTTAAALALRGVPVITEDIMPLDDWGGQFWAVPGYPRVCLWPDAVAKLTGDADALPKLTPVWEKQYLPLDGIRATFTGEKKPLGLVYLFGERSPSENAPRVEALPPRDALLELVRNTYMNWLLDRKQRAKEFEELTRLVRQVPVRRIVAHSDGGKIGALCDLVLADAKKILAKT